MERLSAATLYHRLAGLLGASSTHSTAGTPRGRAGQAAVPTTIAPGPHGVVVVIEETIAAGEPIAAREAITLRPLPMAGWPADATFGREEIYGDDGR